VISKGWNYILEHSFISEELQTKEIESENFQHLVIICEVFLLNGRLYIPTTTNYFQIVHDAIEEVQKWIFG
jgi:thiaminase